MPYNADKDPTMDPPNPMRSSRIGRKGANVVLAAGIINIDPYARLIVTTAGTLSILPVENTDGAWVNLGNVAVGFIPPYEVRAVNGDATTANTATIDY